MKLKLFLVSLAITLVGCNNDLEKNALLEDKINQANSKIMKQGCYITVATDKENNWIHNTDCSGVEASCFTTSQTLRSLNEYRALLFGDRNHETLSGRDKALNDGIGEAIAKVNTLRNSVNPACPK